MDITYQPLANDYLQAILTFRKAHPITRLLIPMIFAVSLIVVPLELFWLIEGFTTGAYKSPAANFLPFSLMCVILSSIFWLLPRFSARKQFNGTPSNRGSVMMKADAEGLAFKSIHSESKIGWSALVRWAENNSVFILFPGPKIFIAIPKRDMTADQITDFRTNLQTNVSPKPFVLRKV